MKNLEVKGLNFDIHWKDKNRNFSEISYLLKDEKADVFLLPEMFSTGFCMDAEEIADKNEESLQFLRRMATEKKSFFGGSASVLENGKFYNRFYFVHPDGTHYFYDKRHLFSYSGEDKIYTPGKEKVIVEVNGWKILLQTCFDLRFPVFARNKEHYDAIFYVANWPETRIDAWKTLLKARAIENQAYVFGLNRIGRDGNNLHYPESSLCFFADGTEISSKNKNCTIAALDYEKLMQIRAQFPFLKDQDLFEIK